MVLLVAQQITHAYRRTFGRRRVSLQGIDLALGEGECLGLVGPNGSGKSTLLRILAGLTMPLAGDVTVAGAPAGGREARRRTGYVPETLVWPRALTVNDALSELAALSSSRGIVGRVDRVAALLSLEDVLHRRLGTLSLGQSRRVVLAQALLDDPPLLLLDEAFSGLDSLVLREVRHDLSRRLARGAAIVLASHRVEDLAGLCTHVMVLRDGRELRTAPAEEVLGGDGAVLDLDTLLGAAS